MVRDGNIIKLYFVKGVFKKQIPLNPEEELDESV